MRRGLVKQILLFLGNYIIEQAGLNSRYRSAWLSATQTMGSFTSFLANTLSCLLWLGITILQGMAYIFYINDIRFAYLAGLVGFHVLHIQPFTEPVAVHLITGNNDE